VLAGTVKIWYAVTNGNGCTDSNSVNITVKALPVVSISDAADICEKGTVQLTGKDGGLTHTTGTWRSENEAIATVNTSGLVTGVLAGTVKIWYAVTNGNGCTDSNSVNITVKALPVVDIDGESDICEKDSVTLTGTPTGAGIWKSVYENIATVDANGKVKGISGGSAIIRYTVIENGCTDSASVSIEIKPLPVVSITGLSSICLGTPTQLSPNTGGTWVSNNPAVASVTNTGYVVGLTVGSATFTFTSTATGCSNTTDTVKVGTFPEVDPITSATGRNAFCVGDQLTLTGSPSGGSWRLSNKNAEIVGGNTNNPLTIKGNEIGKTYVSYTIGTGVCQSTATYLVKIVSTTPPTIIIGIERK
jgi:uncharacterized protein YjdB